MDFTHQSTTNNFFPTSYERKTAAVVEVGATVRQTNHETLNQSILVWELFVPHKPVNPSKNCNNQSEPGQENRVGSPEVHTSTHRSFASYQVKHGVELHHIVQLLAVSLLPLIGPRLPAVNAVTGSSRFPLIAFLGFFGARMAILSNQPEKKNLSEYSN
ncbi:hypothetical protein TNCV_1959181 [Trichonephila clavipes]|nr:hypothetical protein TNCV_1959181 [Trichonephila clavipes]